MRVAAFLAVLLVLGLAGMPASAQPSSPAPPVAGGGSGIGFERQGWTPTRADPFVTLHVRQTIGYLLLVPASTLFLLYVFRPKPYVLAWVVAWTAGSGMLLSLSFDLGDLRLDLPDDRAYRVVAARFIVAAWACYALCFAVFLRWGALWFRQPARLPRWTWWAAALAVGWLSVAAAWLGLAYVVFPAFILMTLWLARGAIVYLRVFREQRFIGALLAGVGVAGIALANNLALVVAVAQRRLEGAATTIAYTNGLWAVLIIIGMHLLVFEDVIDELRQSNTELGKSRDELKTMAVTDALTGCYNRRFLDDVARHELEQHRRYSVPLSLLFIDCDHFKAVNDARGHDVGDQVLQTIGGILRGRTREADYVFRWGGDEFLVLLSAGEEAAHVKADEVRRAFLESAIVAGLPKGVDLSVGCVAVPPEATDLAPLIQQADDAMYRRKRAGA